jgi:hypothetical protein
MTCHFPAIISFLGYDPFEEPKALPECLIAQRRKLGWSRKLAAAQLGIDDGTLASWEGGTSVPRGRRSDLVRDFIGRARMTAAFRLSQFFRLKALDPGVRCERLLVPGQPRMVGVPNVQFGDRRPDLLARCCSAIWSSFLSPMPPGVYAL